MKRIRRFAAVILSAAMVVTSIQVPVYAAQDEDLVIETDLQEDEASVEDATEDPVDEAPADEKSADETPAAEPEEETPAESEEEEFTEVPLEGDAEVKASSENLEEIAVGQSDESDDTLDESVTGNDDTLYVSDAEEFLTALEEAGEKKDSKGKAVSAVIELRSMKSLVDAQIVEREDQDDFVKYDHDQKHFVIDNAMLGDKKLNIPKGADVTIIGNGHTIYFADDAKDKAVMTVEADAVLTLENDSPAEGEYMSSTFGFRIENKGKFYGKNVGITSSDNKTAFDNIAEKAYASFDGSLIVATPLEGVQAIHNAQGAELVIGSIQQKEESYWHISATKVIAKGTKTAAIKNEGSFVLNNGIVTASGTNSCAIDNSADLSVRGGKISSDESVVIYNTGKLGIGSPFAYDADIEIRAAGTVPAILSPGGSVTIGDANQYWNELVNEYFENVEITAIYAPVAVSTTSEILNAEEQAVYTGKENGTLLVYGGNIEGIAYAGENYPTILGGTVQNNDATKVLAVYKSGNVDATAKPKYYWRDTADADAQLIDAVIEDGELILPERTAEINGKWTSVSDADDLIAKLADDKVEWIRLNGVELKAPLEIKRKVVLSGSITVNGTNNIVVTDAAKDVVFENLTIYGSLDDTGVKAIENKGVLTLQNIHFNIYSVGASSRYIENAGTLTLIDIDNYSGSRIAFPYDNVTTGLDGNSKDAGTALLYNKGTFIMQGGTIDASDAEGSHAILYEGDNEPILIKGGVFGSGYPDNEDNSPVKVAVAKWENEKAVTGNYKNTTDEKAASLPTKNSTYISNGVAQESQNLENSGEVHDEYLLMEVGEHIDETSIRSIFDTYSSFTHAELMLESNEPNFVEVKNDPLTITAKAKGHAIVNFKLYDSKEENARLITTNYLRIDVVNKDRRAALVSEHFTGSILNPNVTVNGYKTIGNEPVKFEFHMTDSYGDEAKTGAEDDDFTKIKAETYNVAGILIDDKEFRDYFQTNKKSDGEDGYVDTHYDPEKKLYEFALETLQENGKKSSEGGLATKLMVDDCRKIDNIKISVVLKDAADRVITVPLSNTFNISVKSTVPKFKVNAITINRFYTNRYIANVLYNEEDERNYTIINDPYEYISELGEFSGPAGIEVDTDGDITVSGKKGGKFSSSVVVSNYVGRYPFSATIKVTNKAPKISLRDKKVSIYGEAAAETDIYTALVSKGATGLGDLGKVTAVNVVGKSAEFYKAGIISSARGDDKSAYLNIAIQPKKADTKLIKTMTVDLEVSYDTARKVKGKPYVTKLKLKVSPVDYNKFSVKQTTKPRLNKTIAPGNVAAYTDVEFSLNPKTFKGGKFVVTGLNGNSSLPESLNFGNVTDKGEGNYSVRIIANDKTKDENAKAVKFAVQLMAPDKDGKFVAVLKKPAVMTVNLYEEKEPDIKKPAATIDLSKVKYPVKDETKDVYSKLKATYKVTSVGNWKVTDDSALFDVNTFGFRPGMNKNGDVTSITLVPNIDAYWNGLIQVGNTYTVNVTFDNECGTRVVKQVTVSVKDVKKADVLIDGEKSRTFTLYYNSPYTLDKFRVGNYTDYENADCSTAPYMGLTVKDVTVADENSPYEVIRYQSAYGDHYEYALRFKNNKPVDAATLKKAKTVTLKVTYSNGLTDDYFSSKPSLKKVKVNIPDLPKK